MNHLDDDAELYALGLTDRERDAGIEAHLAQCDACRDRVVAAEAAAASLAAALPPAPAAAASTSGAASSRVRTASPRRPSWAALAAAAAVVFAATAAFEANAAHAANARLARNDGALVAIASSHFGHTTLTAEPGVVAKALYARDGAWCYVVATGAPSGAHVVLHQGAGSRDMGALDGQPATLFLRDAGRADEVDIVAGGHVVAHGKPAY